MKSVVLISQGSTTAVPAGDRIELFIQPVADGIQLDWVHLPRFKTLFRERMTYPGAMIERALNLRFAELTRQGYVVTDTPPIGRAALDIPEEVLAKGLESFVVRRLDATARPKVAGLDAFEQGGLVANGADVLAPTVPALARFAVARGVHTLVLDGNPSRWTREAAREGTTGTPPHRAWLRGWLDALHAAPGAIDTVCLRSCRVHDLELGDRLFAFRHLAFVETFPASLRCAARARELTLGLHDPDGELAASALAGLGEATQLERLALEAARGAQPDAPELLAALAATELPALRELAIANVPLASVISALRGGPLLANLRVLRVDARLTADDLAYLATAASDLAHLQRLELALVPGSETLTTVPGVPVVVLAPSLPVCPY